MSPLTLGPAFDKSLPLVSPIAFASFCDCSRALLAYSCAWAVAFDAVSDAFDAACFAESAARLAVSFASAKVKREVWIERPSRWGRKLERSIGLDDGEGN